MQYNRLKKNTTKNDDYITKQYGKKNPIKYLAFQFTYRTVLELYAENISNKKAFLGKLIPRSEKPLSSVNKRKISN